jgi:hypothetical protein
VVLEEVVACYSMEEVGYCILVAYHSMVEVGYC